MKSLWPSKIEKEEHQITPKEFLSAQIDFLSKATNGKLQGGLRSVSAWSQHDESTNEDFTGEIFIHSMKINSPSLGYSFTMLRLAHQTLKVFPFALYSNLTSKKYKGNSIEDLETSLKEIFSSQEVVEAITSLSSQSEKPEELPF